MNKLELHTTTQIILKNFPLNKRNKIQNNKQWNPTGIMFKTGKLWARWRGEEPHYSPHLLQGSR